MNMKAADAPSHSFCILHFTICIPRRCPLPPSPHRQTLPFHQKRQFPQRRPRRHSRVIQYNRPRPDRTSRSNLNPRHLHHPILKQMRLHRAIQIQRRIIPDADQIKLRQCRRLHVNAPPNFRPHQSKEPAYKRRPRQHLHQKSIRNMLMQRRQQLSPPNKRAPQRLLVRHISPHQNPFTRHNNPRRQNSTSPVQKWKQQKNLRQPNMPARHNQQTNQRNRQHRPHRCRQDDAQKFNPRPLRK